MMALYIRIYFFLLIPALAFNEITSADLKHWDEVAKEVVQDKPDRNKARFYAYLYSAQQWVADKCGNIGPVSAHVVQLFYPEFKNDLKTDEITASIIPQIDQRYYSEQKQIKAIEFKENDLFWHSDKHHMGDIIPSYKTWILPSADAMRLPPPPPSTSPFWQEQLNKMKWYMSELNDERKEKILYWAGETKKSSSWIDIANDYMEKQHTPISKRIKVRAVLATALLDTDIATFDTKYAYLVKRPFMQDPHLKTIIPTPNHPSFPAAHASTAAAAMTILNHYFPENAQNWENLAEESGLSRLWAGIHFPVDIQQGKALGTKIACLTLMQLKITLHH